MHFFETLLLKLTFLDAVLQPFKGKRNQICNSLFIFSHFLSKTHKTIIYLFQKCKSVLVLIFNHFSNRQKKPSPLAEKACCFL